MEVQGLRTVAALLVAIYHIWLHRISGGVDVFFVVAAYFLVAGLLRREPVRLRDILDYYGSTARRVMPGAALVIATTIVAAWFLMPDALWSSQIVHALASIAFVENWWLARSATDYLQQGLATSPFQQMWALSLQMQVYIAFPLVFLLVSLVARLFRRGARIPATLAFGALFVWSLLFSISYTRIDQSVAYFISPTRVWEFAAGALLALWIDRIRIPRLAAAIIGWLGLGLLLTLGIAVDVSRQFPGYLAALPVAAALAIIVSAANGGDIKLLNNRAVTAAADSSFAFYLWHWPLLTFMRYRLGSDDVGLMGGLAVILGAAALAFLSTRLIETPFRRAAWLAPRPALSLGVSVLVMGIAGLILQGWTMVFDARVEAAEAARDLYLANPSVLAAGQLVPETVLAKIDWAGPGIASCNQTKGGPKLLSCVHGDPDSPVTIVAVGGSHVAQWMRTLNAVGKEHGYRIVAMTKDACTFTTEEFGHPSCTRWSQAALKEIIRIKPDLVLAISTRPTRKNGAITGEFVPKGYRKAFAALAEHGIPVMGLRDNPWWSFDVAVCVAAFRPDVQRCGRPFDEVMEATSPTEKVDAPNVTFVDLTDMYCADGFCPAVEDGVLVYRDQHHVTGTFAYLHRDRLAAAIAAALADHPPGAPRP